MAQQNPRAINDLIYIALKRYVIALDRYTGEIVWKWKSPKPSSFTTLLLDGDRLIVSANGYIHCLDPVFGQEVWSNPLTGLGVGVASLVSVHGAVAGAITAPAAAAIAQQQAAAAAAS